MEWLYDWFLFSGDDVSLYRDYSYNLWLVLLSLLVAIYASFIGFQISSQTRMITTRLRYHLSLFAGSVALGAGVWSMHFIAMLAFQMPAQIEYDPMLTFLSMLPSIAASWIALKLIVKREIDFHQLLVGGVLVGAGIGTMHYTGMEAMLMDMQLRYEPTIFALSILVAVLLACLSLWIRFGLEQSSQVSLSALQANLISGGIMGFAISGMHYTGMAAARFIIPPGMTITEHNSDFSQWLSVGIFVTTVVITSLVLAVNLVFRYKDISEEAKSNEHRLQAMMETAIDTIIIHDAKGFILSVNPAVESMLGWSPESLLGKNMKLLTPAALHQDFDQSLQSYLETGSSDFVGVAHDDMEAVHKDGYHVPIRLSVGYIKLPDQGLFVAFLSDMTSRVAMENDLREAKVEAERAVMARQTFLSNMSHEIRTPMNSIIGFTQVLTETILDEEQNKYVDNISYSARSLLHLLDEILDVAKMDQGKIKLNNRNFVLLEEVDMLISSLWVQASKKGLELEVNISPDLGQTYYGSSDRIRQVLNNLLSNAIKFTDEGKVTLDISPDGADFVLFSITDTGIGIEPDRLDSIFEAFTQADDSTSRRFGGTGLGTTISKELVELMGGTITATSEVGVGSCFSFSIPLKPAIADDPAPAQQHHLKLPPMKILVAEDIRQNLDLLILLLEREGHKVSVARNGQEALDQLVKERPDLLLMDVQMPIMDGLQAARRIREDETDSAIEPLPIIALTASVFAEDRKAVFDAGMNGFVAKPIDSHMLNLEIAKIMKLDIPVLREAAALTDTESRHKVINQKKGVEMWGSLSAYVRELNKFQAFQEERLPALQKALDDTDWANAKTHAHALKGVSGNLALSALYRLFARMEQSAGRQDASAVRALMADIREAITQFSQKLADMQEHFDNEPPETTTTPAEPGRLHELTEQLIARAQLNECDQATVNALLKNSDADRSILAEQIARAFNDFEFSEALTLLQRFKADLPNGEEDGKD